MKRTMYLFLALSTATLGGGAGLFAGDIQGSVIIKRRLTRPRVTVAAPLYQRGSAVALDASREDDPLALERSHVVIYLEGPGPATPTIATIEQKNRQFVPETVVIPAGSQVTFPNLDPIFHNIFSLSRVKEFDLGNYRQGDTRTVTFTRPGVVYVNCHLHANMAAAIVVTPNDWSTRAGRSGEFAIRNVPPGRYTAVAWHKTAGFFRQPVEVGQEGAARLEFLLPLALDGTRLEAAK